MGTKSIIHFLFDLLIVDRKPNEVSPEYINVTTEISIKLISSHFYWHKSAHVVCNPVSRHKSKTLGIKKSCQLLLI